MHLRIAAAFALIVSSSLNAQAVADLSTATPIAGSWSYTATADGSEASFANASGGPQLILHCTRAQRRVSISRTATAAAPTMILWTTSQTRSLASSFNPATGRLSADLQAYDGLLDAMTASRGRIGVSVGTQPALVVPPWPELARVVEDCRS